MCQSRLSRMIPERIMPCLRFAGGDGADQRQVVKSDPTPLAIVNGVDEPFVNNNYMQTINYKSLWENKIHLIANAGHAPFWDAPDDFDTLLNRFLL